jgi:hypothetical protein
MKHGLVISSGAKQSFEPAVPSASAVWLLAQQNCTFPETKVSLVPSSGFRCARIPERPRSKETFVRSVQFCCVKRTAGAPMHSGRERVLGASHLG